MTIGSSARHLSKQADSIPDGGQTVMFERVVLTAPFVLNSIPDGGQTVI